MSRISAPRSNRARSTLSVILAAALLLSAAALAQQAPQIDLLVTAFFGVQTMDDCKSRVRAGFQKAGYSNITEQAGDTVKGQMLKGDNAGISSMVACSLSGSMAVLSLASAGGGEGAPNSQNSRLMAAITKP